MTEKNSLKAFREITIQDQNPTRPAQIDQSKDYAGSTNRNKTVSTGTIFGSSAPTYPNFGTNYTTDSIFSSLGNYSYTQEDSKMGAAEIASLTIGGLSAALPLGMGIFQIVKAFKGGKTQNSSAKADSNLSSLTETANNYNDKSDITSMQNTSMNLTTAIETANQKLNNAKRDFTTAETTLTNLSKEKTNYNNKLTTFDTNKDKLNTNLKTCKSELSKLKNLPAEQKLMGDDSKIAELEKQIEAIENQLKTEFSDEKRADITNQISRIEKDIVDWTKRKQDAELIMNKIPSEIEKAKKAKKSLDEKIDKKDKK